MNATHKHLIELGRQSAQKVRDKNIVASAEDALKAGGKEAVDAILAFVEANPDGTTVANSDDKSITVSKRQVYIGSAVGRQNHTYRRSLLIRPIR